MLSLSLLLLMMLSWLLMLMMVLMLLLLLVSMMLLLLRMLMLLVLWLLVLACASPVGGNPGVVARRPRATHYARPKAARHKFGWSG